MDKKTFLVTGGAGFIGSNIVEELLRLGHRVRVLDNFSTGKRENLAPFLNRSSVSGPRSPVGSLELIEADIRDLSALRKAMSAPFGASTSTFTSTSSTPCKGVEVVLHQAALPSVPRSIADPATTHEVGATGTLNVLIAARDCGVRRVVYASSSSVYGDTEELPKHEGMLPNPLSPYAVSKLVGEYYCRVFSLLYGLETVALRYFNVFGPRQDPASEYAAVIPKFIAAIRRGERPTIYGDGEQSRDFTPVANVVAANLAASFAPLGPGTGSSTDSRKILMSGSADTRSVPGTLIRPESVKSVKSVDYPSVSSPDTLSQSVESVKSVDHPSASGPDDYTSQSVESVKSVDVRSGSEPWTMDHEPGTKGSPFLLSNVGTGQRHTLNFLVQELCRLLGKRVEPIHTPPQPGDVRHSQADVALLRNALGVTESVSFADGLKKTIEWFGRPGS